MPASPDRAAMQQAVRDFLRSAGVDEADSELRETPERVAAAWLDEFLDGYRQTPAQALGELSPAPPGSGLISITHVDYTGVCPHHLLPYRGVAHLAYRPGTWLAGFGRFPALIDTLAHRLVLQETLARQIADALVSAPLCALGAAVVLDAEQACMTTRGRRRIDSRVTVDAVAGELDAQAWSRFQQAIAAGRQRVEERQR
jgi:GTP cyclohydrolase I